MSNFDVGKTEVPTDDSETKSQCGTKQRKVFGAILFATQFSMLHNRSAHPAGESDNGQIVLLDEPDFRRLFTRFLVDFADNVLERHLFDDGLHMQDKLLAQTNDTFVIQNSNLKSENTL